MKTQNYILPVQCSNCGNTFDLWHDLVQRKEPTLFEIANNEVSDADNLCWRCRGLINVVNENDSPEEDLAIMLGS